MRCFIAIELTDEAWRPLWDYVRQRAADSRDVRWVGEHQLHLTLKFLGETAEANLPAVINVLNAASARVAPFSIHVGGLGHFPPRGSPRVLWTGVRDDEEGCARWIQHAEPRLAELGFPAEGRRFTPHITMARSRNARGGRRIAELVAAGTGPPAVDMHVRQVTLFESRPGPEGSVYTVLAAARLRPACEE